MDSGESRDTAADDRYGFRLEGRACLARPAQPTRARPPRKKVLFIANTRLGDAVLTTGLLDKALERYGPCDVTVACGPSPVPLFLAVPAVQRVVILDKSEKGMEWLRLWRYALQVYWDVVIDVRNSFVSYLIPRKRVFRHTSPKSSEHKSAQLARAMKLAEAPNTRLWLPEAVRRQAKELLAEGAPVLALCPTSGWSPKNWPLGNYIELARRLAFKRVAVLCAAHERGEVTPLLDALRNTLEVIDLSHTDALEAAACLALCRICVANDSGLMHVSAAVGTPTVAIFGPSNDAVHGPRGHHVAVVRGAPFKPNTPDPGLLVRAVTVESVAGAVEALLAKESVGCAA